jgi:hypothetical protein
VRAIGGHAAVNEALLCAPKLVPLAARTNAAALAAGQQEERFRGGGAA